MKQLYLWIFLLFACWNLFAQSNIVHYEYWLDNDYASKVQADVSPAPTYNLQTTVSSQNMNLGFHTLNARFKDDKGFWSATVYSYFYKLPQPETGNNQIVHYEYWLDNNYASKVQADVPPSQTFNLQTTFSSQNMNMGFHTLNARFKDDKGLWSATTYSYFYKLPVPVEETNAITAYEYWIDDGTRTRQTVSPAMQYVFSQNMDMSNLPAGLHYFHCRFQDAKGMWSSTTTNFFYRMAPPPEGSKAIAAYEYWFNGDYSKKVRVEVAPQQSFVLMDTVNCALANQVVNTIYYRFQDDRGLWSPTVTVDFHQNVTIPVSFNYTRSVAAGETPVTENGYPDYANVGFTLYNITKKQDISDVSFQFPNIVITQQVDTGDSISVTATGYSLANGFNPVTDTVVVGENNTSPVTFNLVQHGLIRANYLNSENAANVGIVYDSSGNRMAQYDYVNQTLTSDPLPDGTYRLLSMAKSQNFNSIQNLSAFASTELLEGTHYILQTLEVKSGIITTTTLPSIPLLDENQLSYTTNTTVFSVNKSLVALSNFVTLRSAVEFKEAYQSQVGNLKLIVDIPDSCSFIAGSVMIGDSVFSNYTIQNNQLTVPMATDSDVVHFCILPLQGGDYYPNAFIEFTLDGKTIRQPIGAAYFQAEGLKISVPSITASKTISIWGIVPAQSLVKVYDNDVLAGQTTALANGNWSMQCDLIDTIGFSLHNVRAEVTTLQGLILQTETKGVIYDETLITVSKVTMYNMAHRSTSLDLQEYVTAFDFQNPPAKGGIYWYWPNYPDFTFTIDFTNNDTTAISNVSLDVLTSSKDIVTLPVIYDNVKKIWVATGRFYSNSLPINVSVNFYRNFTQSNKIVDFRSSTQTKKFDEIWTDFYNIAIFHEESMPQYINDMFYDSFNMFKSLTDYWETPIQSPIDYPQEKSNECERASGIKDFVRYSLADQRNKELFDTDEGKKIQSVLGAILGILDNIGFSESTLKSEKIIENYSEDFPIMKDSPIGCYPPPPPPSFNKFPNQTPVHDPSGFVYEAVPSNRLPDVTASIYQKASGGDPVLWNAADYEEVNPQTTNQYGEYGWDVPQGLWQVKYEKEGYETAYSDWLPVPPPQLNINVGMVNAIPPTVEKAQGYEDGIEITFGKFMQPATMTPDFITVTRNGANETGTVALLDAEENPASNGENFASKVRFVPQTPFLATDNVILTVDSMVLSYAGKNMTDDFVQRIAIEKEVKSLTATPVLNLIINGTGVIEVTANPADAAAGKTITVRPVSSVLTSVAESAVLGADGKALLQVTGELPGSTQIIITLDGTDVQTTVDVSIAMELAESEQVETPTASIPTGSTVAKNTEVSLSCGTEGATIRYTTDGSTPAASSGTEYTQPIVLTGDVTIHAIAVKEGMTDSEIAVFVYKVNETGIEQPNRPVALFVHNRTLIIQGLEPGEQYTVYSVLGNVVTQGKITDKLEQRIPLPYKGIFVVSTPTLKAKVMAK